MQSARVDSPKYQSEEEFQQIVLEQMPQVKYIARRIHEHLPKNVLVEDLVQAGLVGLLDALNKFDRNKNVNFGWYAKFRIRGAILDSLRDQDWCPRDIPRKSRQIDAVTQKLQTELGRAASAPELAEALGLSLKKFHELTAEIRGLTISSLQCIMNNRDAQEVDRAQDMRGPDDEDPFTLCEKEEMHERLESAIKKLPYREQELVMLYYQQELTMKEVGALMGIGESRVSQMHTLMVRHLRAAI